MFDFLIICGFCLCLVFVLLVEFGDLFIKKFVIFFNFSCFIFLWIYLIFIFNIFEFCFFLTVFYSCDIFNIFFLLLTFLISILCILVHLNNQFYYIYDLLTWLSLEFFLINCFLSTDLLIFYIFFESTLIPIYLIIGFYGTKVRRIKAAILLFLFTFCGSLLFLFFILILYNQIGTLNFFDLFLFRSVFSTQLLLLYCMCLFLPFAVKIPILPFHVLLPEAHVEAPAEGSIILAGLLLKIGTFGLLKLLVLIFSTLIIIFFVPFLILISCSILYCSVSIIRQLDIKRIIAYSSIIHMNLAVFGVLTLMHFGVVGGIFLMLAHGITSGVLFLMIGFLYERFFTRIIFYYSGLIYLMPIFGVLFLIILVANSGFPGLCNFIGELFIFIGLFKSLLYLSYIITFSFLFAIIYSIWLFNRICFGTFNFFFLSFSLLFFLDLTLVEIILVISFVLLIIIFGLFPSCIIDECVYYITNFIL